MRTFGLAAMLALATAAPAVAEVKAVADNGFTVASSAIVAAPPARVWEAVTHPGRWWNMAHSYSRDGANLTLDPRAGGCFCETVPKDGGQVEHGRVIQIRPGSLLRLSGALGPFQEMAVSGVLSWELKPSDTGTVLSMTYTVGGWLPDGGKTFAPIVDEVMADQFAHLKAFVEKASH